jgi:hypothetical protein
MGTAIIGLKGEHKDIRNYENNNCDMEYGLLNRIGVRSRISNNQP